MVDSSNLDLSLPNHKKQKTSNMPVIFWLILIFLACITNIVLHFQKEKLIPKKEQGNKEQLKTLALKLEKQNLHNVAIATWKEYLLSDLTDESKSKIWYRIGKIYQKEMQYENALYSYYKSESISSLSSIRTEIGQRVQQCLENMGKFSELSNELLARVGEKKVQAGDVVIAEIGKEKITRSQLNKKLENQIELQLKQFASFLSPEQLRAQKAQMLKRMSDQKTKLSILNQMLIEEMLYRKAREMKLSKTASVKKLIFAMSKKILAEQVLQNIMKSKMHITQTDVLNYFKANQEKYFTPARAKISNITVKEQKQAEDILMQTKGGAKFEALAKKHSLDKDTAKNGGKIEEWIEKEGYIPGIGKSNQAIALIFSLPIGKVADKVFKTDKGWHIIRVDKREDKRLKGFEEVKNKVYMDLRRAKEKDIQMELFDELKDKYKVVIHHSTFMPKPKKIKKK